MSLPRTTKSIFPKKITSEFMLGIFIIIVLIFLRFTTKDFYNENNIKGILNQFSIILIAAIGMNLIILTSNIDVSTGALISFVCISIATIGKMGFGLIILLPVAMIIGGLLSLVNGLFITKFKIPAIVATLATAQLFLGTVANRFPGSVYNLQSNFTWLGFQSKIFGVIYGSFAIMLIVTVFFMLFMRYSKFSKKIYAVGNSREAARLSGINVNKVVIICYVVAGTLFGISATIMATASQRVTGTMGNGSEMIFIAAVVLGGTSISGGKGRILGTVFGAFILALISPAIDYLKLGSNVTEAVTGGIIIIAVMIATIKWKKKRFRKTKTITISPEIVADGGLVS